MSMKDVRDPRYNRRLRELCIEHAVPYEKVIGRGRRAKLCVKRRELTLLMHEEFPELSSTQLGGVMHRDHSTILHSLLLAAQERTARTLPE